MENDYIDLSERMHFPFGNVKINEIFGSKLGFEYTHKHTLEILLQGTTGTGKTTMAVQMAMAFCKPKPSELSRFCIYCTFEETPDELENLVFRFGWSDAVSVFSKHVFAFNEGSKFKPKTVNQNDMEEIKRFREAIVDGEKGAIIFLRLPRSASYTGRQITEVVVDELSTYIEYRLKPILEFVGTSMDRGGLFIFDSINAFIETFSSRALLDSVMVSPRNDYDSHAIFVMENYDSISIPQYVADLVIELGIAGTDKPARYIQPIKARGAHFNPGKHIIRIESGKGIVCLGNKETMYKEMGQRISDIKYSKNRNIVPTFGITGLEALLHKSISLTGLSLDGIQRKSTTLVAGTPGTHKGFIAVKFLSQSYSRERSRALFIGFSDRNEVLLRAIEKQCSIEVGELNEDDVCLWLHPKHLIPEEMLYRIIEKVKSMSIDRIVLYDLAKLGVDDAARDIIDIVLRICESNDIMLLAVETFPEKEKSFWDNMFDNVLLCRFATSPPNPEYRVISISKVVGMKVAELHNQIVVAEKEFDVDIQPGIFEDVVEHPPGQFSFGHIKLTLYQETDAMNAFMEDLKQTIVDEFPSSHEFEQDEKPQVMIFGPSRFEVEESEHTNTDSVFDGVLFHPTFTRRNITEVLTFDEIWAKELLSKDLPSPLLSPMDSIDRHFEERQWPESISKRVEYRGRHYAYPFYLNVGVFCFRNDLTDLAEEKLRSKTVGKDIDEIYKNRDEILNFIHRLQNDDEIQWHEVFDHGESIQTLVHSDLNITMLPEKNAQPKTGSYYRLFDFCLLSPECLNAFMLELLWPVLMQEKSDKELFDYAMALRDLWSRGMFGKKFGDCIHYESIFSRHWYCSYLDLEKHLEDSYLKTEEDKSKGGIISRPQIKLRSMPTVMKGENTISLSGDWFIGVLAGALNLRRGIHIIEYIIDRAQQKNAFSNFLGLEPHMITNVKGAGIQTGDTNQLRAAKIRVNAVSRCDIGKYMKIKADLTGILMEFFDSYERNEQFFSEEKIIRILKKARELIK